MKKINTNPNNTHPNVVMVLFKHLEKKQDISNLFYNLANPIYSINFANWVIDKMSEKIKEFFVAYAADTSVIKWNKNGEGVYALVFDPTYEKKYKTDFTNFISLVVGGFAPDNKLVFNFRGRQIRGTDVIANSWKLQWYQARANQTASANAINISTLSTTIKFTLARYQSVYKYTKHEAAAASTPVTPPTTPPNNQPVTTTNTNTGTNTPQS